MAASYLSYIAYIAALDIETYPDNFLVAHPPFRNGYVVESVSVSARGYITRA